jgi:hypothetical protein
MNRGDDHQNYCIIHIVEYPRLDRGPSATILIRVLKPLDARLSQGSLIACCKQKLLYNYQYKNLVTFVRLVLKSFHD